MSRNHVSKLKEVLDKLKRVTQTGSINYTKTPPKAIHRIRNCANLPMIYLQVNTQDEKESLPRIKEESKERQKLISVAKARSNDGMCKHPNRPGPDLKELRIPS